MSAGLAKWIACFHSDVDFGVTAHLGEVAEDAAAAVARIVAANTCPADEEAAEDIGRAALHTYGAAAGRVIVVEDAVQEESRVGEKGAVA